MSSLKISTPKLALRQSTPERVKGAQARPSKQATGKLPRAPVTDGFVPPRKQGKGVGNAGSGFEPARQGSGRAGSSSGAKAPSGQLSQALMDSINKAATGITSSVAATDKAGQRKAISDFVKSLGLSKEESRLVKWTTSHAVKALYASGAGASGNKTFGGGE